MLVSAYSLAYTNTTHMKHNIERQKINNAEYTRNEGKNCSNDQTPSKTRKVKQSMYHDKNANSDNVNSITKIFPHKNDIAIKACSIY